ncbi:uncharacterized protein LOC126675140 [Mercurialis annua]|uniref:uncharacterized protein LOC126675140 n=1 Tax=Mercurialis annua TaxID=3986 RepID=UPI00215FCD4A|nr:uncharacterized protein LOC126675140 [Mercurialis annua]
MAPIVLKVFISFRGADCRDDFLSYLCAELRRQKNVVVLTDEDFKRGNEIESEIRESIQESTASIAIISEDYGGSDACLDELVLMLKRQEIEGDAYMVLPVFFYVTKEEVKTQTGSFAHSLAKMRQIFEEQQVKVWVRALTKVADLGGRDVINDEPENDVCNLIVQDVLRHVHWLNNDAVVPATSYEKPLGVAACLAETTKKYGESVSHWNGSPSNTGCLQISVEEDEAQPEEKCNGKIVGRSQSCFASEEECVRRPAFMALLEKLVGGDSSSRGIDSDRFESVTHSSEQSISKRSVQEALLTLKSFFSEDPEIVSQKLGDCKDSFQILKSLTEKDGLNTMGMMMLPNLEQESAAVIQKRLSGAQGRKEVELKIHKQHQLSVEVQELLEEYNKVEKTMNSNRDKARQLESQISRLQAQLVAVQGKHEEDTRCFHDLTAELKSRYEELKNLKNANLVKQKSDIEEFEQHACKEWEMIENVIDEAIPKFCTTNN